MSARKERHSRGTPALALLSKQNIPHTVHEFARKPDQAGTHVDYGLEAADAMGVPPASVFKTLVWSTSDSSPPALLLALVPVDAQVSPKMLAAAVGAKKVALATSEAAERVSGSVVGAISPLGMRQRLPVVLDFSAEGLQEIFVSAGRRGLEICLAPRDLIAATNATVAPIAVAPGHS